MRRLSDLVRRYRGLFRGGREDTATQDELRFHLEMEAEKNLRAGMDPREARRQAHVRLGGVDAIREAVRDVHGGRLLEDLLRDLGYALRGARRNSGFTLAAVLTLTLAFSIPAVVLSTVDRHFWRPLDLPGSDRLFTLQIWVEDGYFSPLSHPEYLQLREVGAEAEAFSLAAFGILDFTMVAAGASTRVDVALVSGDFFTLLGAAPTHGRLLEQRDDDPSGAPAVAVVSRRAWTTHFGRDPDLVGRTVRLGSQVFTVVGVAANPLPGPAHDPDFWVPLSAVDQLLPNSSGILDPFGVWLGTVGRLGGIENQQP